MQVGLKHAEDDSGRAPPWQASLSDYVLREVKHAAELPPLKELGPSESPVEHQ
jgi:hypothetical protein